MTETEQRLADDKMRAEIANLIAQNSNLYALNTKLAAETARISKETVYIPLGIGAAIMGTFTALVVSIIKLV